MEFNRKMRKKWGEPKKKSVLFKGTEKKIQFPSGVDFLWQVVWMGQNGSKLGVTENLFRFPFGPSKGTEIFFRFSLFFDF